MLEMVRILFCVLLVGSFASIAVYVLISLVVAAVTLIGSVRRDRSGDELDQVLTEILGPRTPEIATEPGTARLIRRR